LANIEKALVVYTKNHAKSEFWKKHYHRTLPLDKLFR
jgi:hypothetical protein